MAITEQERRRQQIRIDLVLFFILFLMGAQYFIHMGAVLPNYPDFDLLTQLDPLLDETARHAVEYTFYIPKSEELLPFGVFSLFYLVAVTWYITTRKKLMPGKEHGSARWSKPGEIKRLTNKAFYQNIILTQTEQLSLNMQKTRRNNNVMVIGDSGAGKTRFFIKPNIMQLHTSYVITDPKGEILQDTGKMLEQHGYTIKVFNLFDMSHSCCYSPFKYIRDEEDIEKMIECLIRNTTPPNAHQSDPYWEKAEKGLLKALCSFIYYRLPEEEQNFNSVLRLLRMLKIYEEDEDYEADLDILFKNLEKEEPDNLAVLQYKDFKAAAGKTLKSIVTQVNSRLSSFNLSKVADLTHKDTLELERIPEEKVALFIIIPDSDTTFHFLAAMLYSQMFEFYSKMAFKSKNKKLKNHVRFLFDEFANIGNIPNFAEHLSTVRSKNFSICPILQDITQLDKHYKDSKNSIITNCNSKLYLAGDEKDSTKYISEMLGKETIDVKTHNYTRGRQRSIADNYQKVGRALMDPDEIGRMPDTDCILFIKGKNPWYSKKYDITKHKKYRFLYDGESGEENYFDYREFVTPKRPKTQSLEASGNKNTKKAAKAFAAAIMPDYDLKELQVNIGTIKKLRYAVEFEQF